MGYLSAATNKLRNEGLLGLGISVITEITHYSQFSPYFRDTLGDRLYYKLKLYDRLGYWPNIRQPGTFNEKITYRKLYTDNDLYPIVSDKYKVRDYVEREVGDKYLNELLYETTDPETIPFRELPGEFVIKATHGSGWNEIITRDEEEDPHQIINKCEKWLSSTYGTEKDEYWYSDTEPRIIIEEYLHSEYYSHPIDYKLFVFNGDVEFIQADINRFGDHTRTLYDRHWQKLEVELEYPIGPDIQKPPDFEVLVEIAEQLGGEFDFVRVDLYNPQPEMVRFGEMTLAPGSGHERFDPREYDRTFGSKWDMFSEKSGT
jgi:hypothetical protein